MIKRCSRCKQELPIVCFGKNAAKKDNLQTQCKTCKKLSIREWYHKNGDHQRSRVNANRKVLRDKNRALISEYLRSHPCVDCGEADLVVLEFDHVCGNKEADISKLMNQASIQKILEEIKKCEVRCANCHRRKTYQRDGSWRLDMVL